MKKIIALLAVTVVSVSGFAQGKEYLASYFGIKSNGMIDNTTSIQKAIDFIAEQGGGTLTFSVAVCQLHISLTVTPTCFLHKGCQLIYRSLFCIFSCQLIHHKLVCTADHHQCDNQIEILFHTILYYYFVSFINKSMGKSTTSFILVQSILYSICFSCNAFERFFDSSDKPQFKYCSITRPPIGTANLLPQPPPSTITATAILGFSTGA